MWIKASVWINPTRSTRDRAENRFITTNPIPTPTENKNALGNIIQQGSVKSDRFVLLISSSFGFAIHRPLVTFNFVDRFDCRNTNEKQASPDGARASYYRNAPELAAWTMVANVLLHLDETISKD